MSDELFKTVLDIVRSAQPAPKQDKPAPHGVYGEWCRDPKLCAGKGYCPRNPSCAD